MIRIERERLPYVKKIFDHITWKVLITNTTATLCRVSDIAFQISAFFAMGVTDMIYYSEKAYGTVHYYNILFNFDNFLCIIHPISIWIPWESSFYSNYITGSIYYLRNIFSNKTFRERVTRLLWPTTFERTNGKKSVFAI